MPHAIVAPGTTRGELQEMLERRSSRMAGNALIGSMVAGGLASLGLASSLLGGIGPVAFFMMLFGLLGLTGFLVAMTVETRRGRKVAFMPGSIPIDAAILSVTEVLVLFKRAGRTSEELQAAAGRMVDQLRTVSTQPPTAIKEAGYHPDGDEDEKRGLDYQWARIEATIRELWPMHNGQVIATEDEVQGLIARMIPPLRTILRSSGIFMPGLEYGGYDPAALRPPTGKELQAIRPAKPGKPGKKRPALPAPTPAAAAPTPIPDDVFSPIEHDLNAAAGMLVATLRTQIAAFRNADMELFAGSDRQSGEALVDVHLPSLLRAYRTAHDASQGEERDDVRAEFARTLKTVRDSLDQIMVRHAREARAVLETEGRFLASRRQSSDLDPEN